MVIFPGWDVSRKKLLAATSRSTCWWTSCSTLQLHLLSDGKVLHRTSTRYAAVNWRLTELWSQYAADQQLVDVTVLA